MSCIMQTIYANMGKEQMTIDHLPHKFAMLNLRLRQRSYSRHLHHRWRYTPVTFTVKTAVWPILI
jgi:hypothetical protein